MEWSEAEGTEAYQTGSDSDRAKMRAGWEKDFSADFPESVVEQKLTQVTQPIVSEDASDFIPGMQRGLQNLQAMTYGAGALAGSGLKKLGMEDAGQKLQDVGMEGYRRNIEEAKQYPKKHSFKDIYTGKTGVGGAIDWAQGTLGELVPSMVEAAVGAVIGSAAAPGPGTAVGALAGRTVLKKGIEKTIQQAMKHGAKDLTESQVRKQVTRQALKKLGGKAGIGAAVMPMESGGMYADLLETKGIDAPETALLFGALATSLEFFGGNSKLVDTFVDALGNGAKGIAKKSAREILTNIPQEALQEGGQELFGILNTVANTDEELLTAENVESIIESMAAGAVGGGAGAVVQAATNTGQDTAAAEPQVDTVIADEIDSEVGAETTPKVFQPTEIDQRTPEEKQGDLERLFGQPINKDAEESAQAFEDNAAQQEEILNQILQEKDLTKRQGLQDIYNNLFIQPSVKDAAESAETFLTQRFTENERVLIEDYWQGVKQALNLRQEEMTPGTEAAMKKKFFETKLAEIEGNVAQDTETQTIAEQEVIPSLAEQNKRQAWFQQTAEDLGDFPTTNIQTIDRETPRPTQPFIGEQQGDQVPQFQVEEQSNKIKNLPAFKKWFDGSKAVDSDGKPLTVYHGTNEVFSSFSSEKLGTASGTPSAELGFFFASNPAVASSYADNYNAYENVPAFRFLNKITNGLYEKANEKILGIFGESAKTTHGNVLPMYVNLKNPLTVDLKGTEYREKSYKDIIQEAKDNGHDGVIIKNTFDHGYTEGGNEMTDIYVAFKPNQIKSIFNNEWYRTDPNFQITENQEAISKVNLVDIEKTFPNQTVTQDTDGNISVQLKNGQGITIKSIQNAGDGFVKLAIETGQMSKNGKILGITVGNEILLDENFADNKTLWHENKHVLDNLGMITESDNNALNKEFNKLRKANKLDFALSTHEDPKQRVVENRANMFAQIMVNRESYRDTAFGKTIQRIMDFFQQMLAMGQQSVSGLARETESGKIYSRKVGDQIYNTTVHQAEVTANTWYSGLEKVVTSFQQKKATPDQWKGMIKNIPGIKAEELEWVGVNEWLDEQTSKVSKEALVNYIKDNNVRLEEVHKGTERDAITVINEKIIPLGYKYIYDDYYDNWAIADSKTETLIEPDEIPENVNAILEDTDNFKDLGGSKYDGYQLPGGENYREMLITMPQKKTSLNQDAQEMFGKDFDTLSSEEFQQLESRYGEDSAYQTAHWDEPNILAHVRFNEQTDAEGNRVLFINEIQSDWHQAGRKEGYTNKGIPDAPFKKSWPMLSMKRMVKYAAENNFDKISWPSTPEQVAEIEGWGTVRTEQTDKGTSYFIHGDQNVSAIMNRYLVDLPRMLNKEFNKGKWGKAKVEKSLFNAEPTDLVNLDAEANAPFEMFTLPITDKMRSNAMREGMAMFEVREGIAEQKIPQAEYESIRTEKNSLIEGFAQQARMKLTEVKLLADKALGSISTRLKNVDPELAQHLRWLDFNTSQKIIDILKTAKPILDSTKAMNPADKSAWNWARLNSDEGKIEQLTQKYNLTEHLTDLRKKLNGIRDDAKEVGYDVGFIEEYWPRVIKDQEGFLQATQEISQRPVFTEAIRDQAKKLGISQEQFEREFPEVKADIISNLILGNTTGIGGPGNIQSRVFETIPKEYAKFYMDADAALMQYVYSMTKKIEARKFFGKVPKRISDLKSAKKQKQADIIKHTQLADMARAENPEALAMHEEHIAGFQEALIPIDEKLDAYKMQRDYTENIGTYIDRLMVDGRIEKKDEKMVRDILDARFNEHGTTGIVNAYKNLSYIDTMGSPLSAITQIGDLAWAMYVGKVWTPKGFVATGKNLAKAISGKSDITKEDLGIERIAQEFADGTTLSKGVSKVFKYVGLEKIDTIGKEVLINNALAQYKAEALENPDALAKQIRPTFGKKSTDVVQEILADNPSENVKMLLYSRLLDFQPVALSEMPEYYLNSGNGRVFYMLKTYTLKQMDVFRREVVHNIKNEDPKIKIQGMKNMVQLLAVLTLANATADEMKDFMLGKETRFSDNVIDNLMTMGGASRYTRMQISREGFGSALAQQILPPMKFINSASKDMQEGYKNYISGDTSNFDHARIIDSIPGVGKLLYWHVGRGEENKKSLAESDFKKDSKDARLFKKQLENSDDKRLFIETNFDRFKQMKLQENFQSALNRNKAVINKLEKIPSTANVQTRLGQLKAQREQILKRYFDAAERM